jgi:hypothetical protein
LLFPGGPGLGRARGVSGPLTGGPH